MTILPQHQSADGANIGAPHSSFQTALARGIQLVRQQTELAIAPTPQQVCQRCESSRGQMHNMGDDFWMHPDRRDCLEARQADYAELESEVAALRRILGQGNAACDVRTLRNIAEQKNKVVEKAIHFIDGEGLNRASELISAVRDFQRITAPAEQQGFELRAAA